VTRFSSHAAWILVVTYSLSLLYEVYRATVKAGTSKHDSLRTLVLQGIPLYAAAGAVIALLFVGWQWSAWLALIFSAVMIFVSIFYYNPRIMLERRPGIIDWFEDLVFTGLLFVAAALLVYEVLGNSLASG
jgi:hypothetical protein